MAEFDRSDPEQFGRVVLGPVFAEFCLRLHLLASSIETLRPGSGVMMWCARGGLRMQLGWERFLAATSLPVAMSSAPLMVSRLAAIRPALARTVTDGLPRLLPAVERTIEYEFSRNDLATTVRALSGVTPGGDQSAPTTPRGLVELLRSHSGREAAAAIVDQGDLFTRHFDAARDGRSLVVLVDTGLFGTTRAVLSDAYPDLDIRCVLLARAARADLAEHQRGTVGLAVEAAMYSSSRRRTSLLRYWHFVEWLFEPALPSVTTFTEDAHGLRSDLEVDGWEKALVAEPGSAFAGLLGYLDGLRADTVVAVPNEADRAWTTLKRSIVWPTPSVGRALAVGTRSHDFGRGGTWEANEWSGPLSALRGSIMWREGIIARSGGGWRLPLLAGIEAAYLARAAHGRLVGRRSS